ncbi:hypothetical protein B0H13DRAFT_1862633 [Mycena leptocephala]|nr:hypothetical protein B0H13DRAFT_1862633 [Mycena leptocephala]
MAVKKLWCSLEGPSTNTHNRAQKHPSATCSRKTISSSANIILEIKRSFVKKLDCVWQGQTSPPTQTHVALTNLIRRRTGMKGTDREGADKKAAQESTRRFRERNSQELANRQRVRRAHTFIDKYGWDTWTDQHTRRMQQAEQRAAAAQKEMREAQGLAEEEDEWADGGRSCSRIDGDVDE